MCQFYAASHHSDRLPPCKRSKINERKYVIFTRHRTIQIVFHHAKEANKWAKICQFYAASPFRSSSTLQKKQNKCAKIYLNFTQQFQIQIVFHPAKEANKCAKICQFYAASPHSDRLTSCAQKINVIFMLHYTNPGVRIRIRIVFGNWIRISIRVWKMDPAMRSLITSQGKERRNFPLEKGSVVSVNTPIKSSTILEKKSKKVRESRCHPEFTSIGFPT